MKNVSLLLVIIMSATLIFSCEDNKDNPISLTNKYLPLEEGNYWQLDYLEKREIVGTKEINNKMYSMLKYIDDTSFYRIENNKVYVLNKTENNEALKFKLTANVNDTWFYHDYKVTLKSKTDTIKINNVEITGCYHFYFDIPGAADEEHAIWLAPEIGFVMEQCGFCPNQIKKLSKANIDGQEIDYALTANVKIMDWGSPAFDGCGWVIRIDNSTYTPVNLSEELKIDNLVVEITYNLLDTKAICGFGGFNQEIYILDPEQPILYD